VSSLKLIQRDREYREALQVPHGPLPAVLGTISHGGSASARRRAAKSSRRTRG